MNYIDKVRNLFVCPKDWSSLASIIQMAYNIKYKDRLEYILNDLPFGYIESRNGCYDNYRPRFKDRDDMCNSFLIDSIFYILTDRNFNEDRFGDVKLRIHSGIYFLDLVWNPLQSMDRLLDKYTDFETKFDISTIKVDDSYITKVSYRDGKILDVSSTPTYQHSRLIAVIKVLNALN